MTLEMTSLTLARVASMFVYIRARFRVPLRSVDGGGGGGTGELEAEFKFQRSSCKLSFLFSPLRQSAPESLLAGQCLST